jgi:hypothetical protein
MHFEKSRCRSFGFLRMIFLNRIPGIMQVRKLFFATLLLSFSFSLHTAAQKTQIKGFVDALVSYQKDKLNFSFGEQDLFITSEITDRLSFLGESVFKFTLSSPTSFVSVLKELF